MALPLGNTNGKTFFGRHIMSQWSTYEQTFADCSLQVKRYKSTSLKLFEDNSSDNSPLTWYTPDQVREQLIELKHTHQRLKTIESTLIQSRVKLDKEMDLGHVAKAAGIAVLGLVALAASNNKKKTWVPGYRRKDGTKVKGHWKNVNTLTTTAMSSSRLDKNSQNQLRSDKEVLLAKYNELINEIKHPISSIESLIEKGEEYILNPQRFIEEKEYEKRQRVERIQKQQASIRSFNQAIKLGIFISGISIFFALICHSLGLANYLSIILGLIVFGIFSQKLKNDILLGFWILFGLPSMFVVFLTGIGVQFGTSVGILAMIIFGGFLLLSATEK